MITIKDKIVPEQKNACSPTEEGGNILGLDARVGESPV